MKEIECNKNAWSRLSEAHYHTFKALLESGNYALNAIIDRELGDLTGLSVLHMQCNTGADTIALARRGAAHVTGVDLVPENIEFARRMASELGVENVSFAQADVMTMPETYHEKHDMVFTSEGVLGWLPDLTIWARAVSGALKEGGRLYVFDSHPFYMMLDETILPEKKYDLKYHYFAKQPDFEDGIGGYASERVSGVETYFWMHTMSDIINSLIGAGMRIERLGEFTGNFFDSGGMTPVEGTGLYEYDYNADVFPLTCSLSAVKA